MSIRDSENKTKKRGLIFVSLFLIQCLILGVLYCAYREDIWLPPKYVAIAVVLAALISGAIMLICNTRHLLWNYVVILFGTFTLLCFAPLEIYLTNISEFWFPFRNVGPWCVLAFVVSSIIGVSVCFILGKINKKITDILTFCYFAVCLLLYLQGNYVINTQGALNGTEPDWKSISPDRITSAILWIAGIIIAVCIILRVKDRVKVVRVSGIIALCIILVESVTLTTVAISQRDSFSEKEFYYATNEKEMELSSNKNVIILVLDSFDASLMNDLLAGDMAEEYKTSLDGFTFYPDTLGSYDYTVLALPEILTGIKYTNHIEYGEYMKDGLADNPLYRDMLADNWSMGFYTPQYLTSCEFFKNACNTITVDRIKISSKIRLLKYVYMLPAYKYSPYEMKKLFWFDPSIFDSLKDVQKNDKGNAYFDWSNADFKNSIPMMTADNQEGVFKLYHLMGPHRPSTTNECGDYVDEEVDDITDAKGNIYILNMYIEALKANGIYDNTAMVVMADHGLRRDEKSSMAQNPLLMIKGFGESHELEVTDKPLTYENLRLIYKNLMDGEQGAGIVKDIDNEDRYFMTLVDEILPDSHHTGPIKEYILEEGNKADDAENLVGTGTVYEWQGE